MKKIIIKKTIISSLAMLAVTASATELNVVGTWSSLSLHKNYEAPFWSKQIIEKTDKKFTSQVTTFDQMGIGGGDVFRYLNDGMFDVGMTVADYTVSDAPELEGLDIPMIAKDVSTAKKVAEAFMPIAEQAANKRFKSHVLAIVPYPQQVMFCKGEVKSLDDIKDKKVRASGRSAGEFVNALGAKSINIPFNEVPGALERGVIDCAVTGSLSGYSAKWHEVSSHLISLPVGGWDYVITMINNEKWKSLSADDQKTLQATVDIDFIAPVWENAVTETQQGIACLTGKGECKSGDPAKMTLVNVSEEAVKKAQKLAESDVLPKWASRVDEETLKLWNESVGKVVGLTAKKK